MREIKFRAWDAAAVQMFSNEQLDEYDKDGVMHWMDIVKPDNREGIIVMQFTGLKDKNGNDIYEGDITDDGYIIGWNDNATCYGYFKHGSCQKYPIYQSDVIRIKGNIHQNPELL